MTPSILSMNEVMNTLMTVEDLSFDPYIMECLRVVPSLESPGYTVMLFGIDEIIPYSSLGSHQEHLELLLSAGERYWRDRYARVYQGLEAPTPTPESEDHIDFIYRVRDRHGVMHRMDLNQWDRVVVSPSEDAPGYRETLVTLQGLIELHADEEECAHLDNEGLAYRAACLSQFHWPYGPTNPTPGKVQKVRYRP